VLRRLRREWFASGGSADHLSGLGRYPFDESCMPWLPSGAMIVVTSRV
jgi:hypothetical protein